VSATGSRAGLAAGRLADAVRRRAHASGGRPALRRPRPRTLLAAAAAIALLLAGWLWLRDSSLVAVRTVQVTGVPGPQGVRIRAALEQAAHSMTTLDVRSDALDTAVAPFSLVKRIEVSTSFPHTLRIHVVTNVAVGAVVAGGREIAVTSDGSLLRDVSAPAGLAQIELRSTPAGARLTDPAAVAAVEALGAAPAALRAHVAAVRTTSERGLTLQLAHGPLLIFGSADRFAAKWAAAAAVLADANAAGATAIDVSAPERPAVAGLPGGAAATGASDVPTPPSGSAGTGATAPPAATPPSATTTTG
jgi:cell division protein FtsQ